MRPVIVFKKGNSQIIIAQNGDLGVCVQAIYLFSSTDSRNNKVVYSSKVNLFDGENIRKDFRARIDAEVINAKDSLSKMVNADQIITRLMGEYKQVHSSIQQE